MMLDDGIEISLFETYMDQEMGHLSASSKLTYKKVVSSFIMKNVGDLSLAETYNEFLARKVKKSECRYNTAYYALKYFIKYKFGKAANGILDKLIKTSSNTSMKTKKRQFTDEEVLNIINSIPSYNHKLIAYIQFFTGLRAGDVLRMQRGIGKYDGGSINWAPHPKTGNQVLKLNVMGKGGRVYNRYIVEPSVCKLLSNYCDLFTFKDKEADMAKIKETIKKNKGSLFNDVELETYATNALGSKMIAETADLKELGTIELEGAFGYEKVYLDKNNVLGKVSIEQNYYFIDNDTYRSSSKKFISIYNRSYIKYWRAIKMAIVSQGYDVKEFATHDFRRNYAQRVWKNFNGDINVLKSALGHKDITTTLRYLQQSGLDNIDIADMVQ